MRSVDWGRRPKHCRLMGTGMSFGTFGELLQGVLPDGSDFLVTLPIDRYSYAYFFSDWGSQTLRVFPPSKRKSRDLAADLLERLDLPPGGVLRIESEIPEGKGLASSSADLVASARAIESWFGLEIPTDLLCRAMFDIEPSDGVMFDGTVAFYHRRVELRDFLGPLPPLTIVAVDEGGSVDTLAFNRIPKPFGASDRRQYAALLDAAARAIRERDLSAIGQVATQSALMNQKLRPKATLARMIAISEAVGGLGVAVAHSGTYVGILLSPYEPAYERQLAELYRTVSQAFGQAEIFHTQVFEPGGEEATLRDAGAEYRRLHWLDASG